MTCRSIENRCAKRGLVNGNVILAVSCLGAPIQLMRRREYKTLLLLFLPILSGCFVHTRTVKQAKMPSAVMSATAEELVQAVNKQCQEIHSLSATVEFQATEGGPRKGREKTYTSFSGYILLRKPEAVRVIGLLPVLHTRAFDMASDGNTFKLLIYYPHDRVIEGSNTLTKESANPLESLRPKIFFDSLLINCIRPDELVTLTTDTETKPDPKSKQMMVYPEYDLTVVRQKANSQELIPQRVIHFSRIDLHTVQEDIYDSQGDIQTQAIYGPMQQFGTQSFPGMITIKRPLEEYQFVLTIQKLNVNLELKDDQFELKIPEGTPVQKLQ
jgi:outer membrane lipoprotein-sorting protein